MTRVRALLPTPFAVLALLFAAPAANAQSLFDTTFKDYKKDGRIDACLYTPAQLETARSQVPPDIEQYAPDFPAALDAAIERHASGDCEKAARTGGAAPTASPQDDDGVVAALPGGAAPTPSGTAPGATPAPAKAEGPAGAPTDRAVAKAADAAGTDDSGADAAPAPLLVLALLGGLLALAGLIYGIARWLAFQPRWLAGARHAAAEAGYRAGGTWSEFTDWVRLGR